MSISSMLNARLFVPTLLWQLILRTCNKKKAAKMTFVQKKCVFHDDEIDGL